MADTKLNWLEEVKADARYNYLKRKREREEDAAYKQAKEEGKVAEPGSDGYTAHTDKRGREYFTGPNGQRVSREEFEANRKEGN